MRLRCEVCGCYVSISAIDRHDVWRDTTVQPCKRCLSRTDLGQVVIAVHLFAFFKVLARDYERAASAASE